MRVHLVSPHSLDSESLSTWRAHQQADESLHGPFFTPEYVRIAAGLRPSVEVAVLESPGLPPGFLPFDRGPGGIARAVGLRAADFSGAIAAAGHHWSPADTLRGCRLNGWDFTHVCTDANPLRPYFRTFVESPLIDVSQGAAHFAETRQRQGSTVVASTRQKRRKFVREVGAVRLEMCDRDRRALDQLAGWKAAQRARTGTIDVLQVPWFWEMLQAIHATDTPEFAGVLSTLYAGDRVAAVHFGMRSRTVLHYWFAAYNPEFERYSPGLILLLDMIDAAAGLGLRTITLGHGREPYKQRFATASTRLASGSVDRRLLRRGANHVWYSLRALAHRSPAVEAIAKAIKRARYAPQIAR